MLLVACGGSSTVTPQDIPDIPIDVPTDKPDRSDCIKGAWTLAMINVNRLNSRAKVAAELERMQTYGLNEIWLDVKPSVGYALYESDILPRFKSWDGQAIPDGYDYLGTVIEEADKLGMGVIACINTLGYGDTKNKVGLVYDDSRWKGKTQCHMVNNDPTRIEDIRDGSNAQEDGAFLEPTCSDVQDFVVSVVKEICTKYPGISGICLDYCRYINGEYGMSDAALDNFRSYCGNASVGPADIIKSDGSPGSFYAKWIEFRSTTIRNLVSRIASTVKACDPTLKMTLFASADYESRYLYGQNWASSKYMYTASNTFTDKYNETSFAELLDVFAMGAYTDHMYSTESYYSIEGYLGRYQTFMMNATPTISTLAVYNHQKKGEFSEAVYMSMNKTDGLLLFDLYYLNSLSLWDELKQGLSRSNAL